MDQAAIRKLHAHPWPGNVRELDNVIQRALILAESNCIGADSILLEGLDWQQLGEPVSDTTETVSQDLLATPTPEADKSSENLGSELREQEYAIILETLVACDGRRKEMAEKLGISPRTLRYKLAKMRDAGIEFPG